MVSRLSGLLIIIVAFIVLLVSNSFYNKTSNGNIPTQAYDNDIYSIDVYSANKDIPDSGGIGFAIDKHTLVTNYHVIQSPQKIMVHDESGDTFSASLYQYDVKSDIALLRTTKELNPLELETIPLFEGDKVFSIHNSKIKEGVVAEKHSSLSGTKTILKYLTLEGFNTEKGDSGSPVFNSAGKVVGIVAAINKEYTYAIPLSDANKIIFSLLQGNSYSHICLGIDVFELTNYHPQYPGLMVKRVIKDSLTFGKLQAEDIIKNVNGKPVSTYQDMGFELFCLDDTVDSISISIIRNGESINIPIAISHCNTISSV